MRNVKSVIERFDPFSLNLFTFKAAKMKNETVRNPRNYFVITLIIFALTGKFINVAAEVKEMSATEFSDFQKGCMQDPKCAKALSALTRAMKDYENELKAVCENSKKECIKRQKENYTIILENRLSCETGMNEEVCSKKLNEDADAFEQELLYGGWCDSNEEACAVLRKESEARITTNKSWCDVNKEKCLKILSDHRARNKRAADEMDKLREEVKKQHEIYKKAREEEWYLSRATCEGDPEKCLSQINEKMNFFEKRRLDRSCQQGKKQLCTRLKEERSNRAEQKLSWCDTHKKICEDAKEKLLAASEKKK